MSDSGTSVTHTFTQPGCRHANGWTVSVRFWIFTKRVYVCSDCGDVLEATHGAERREEN